MTTIIAKWNMFWVLGMGPHVVLFPALVPGLARPNGKSLMVFGLSHVLCALACGSGVAF